MVEQMLAVRPEQFVHSLFVLEAEYPGRNPGHILIRLVVRIERMRTVLRKWVSSLTDIKRKYIYYLMINNNNNKKRGGGVALFSFVHVFVQFSC